MLCYKIKEIKSQEKRSMRRRLYLDYSIGGDPHTFPFDTEMNLQQFSSMLLFIEFHNRNEHVNLIRKAIMPNAL